MKWFSIQPQNYRSLTQVGWGCELFYAIIPTSFSYLLLFCYPYMLLLITCTLCHYSYLVCYYLYRYVYYWYIAVQYNCLL